MGPRRRLANATPLQMGGSDSGSGNRARTGGGWPGLGNDRALCSALDGLHAKQAPRRQTPPLLDLEFGKCSLSFSSPPAVCTPAVCTKAYAPFGLQLTPCRPAPFLPSTAPSSQSTPLRSPIENFYMTDAISRASRTMAKCVLARQQAQAK